MICDYCYGLKEAIADGVCRSPRIILLDNQNVKLTEGLGQESNVRLFPNIGMLLDESPVTYDALVRHDEVIAKLLEQGSEKLNDLRQTKFDAAGLIVATDVEHAQRIAKVLETRGESFRVVTNQTPDAQQKINDFRKDDDRWIVAVGMISEGTDIPRLQVCCYLSRIRTELHYRQVLGRVLRRMGESDDKAWLFMLAEPTLRRLAQRIADDLPHDLAVLNQIQIPPLETALTGDRNPIPHYQTGSDNDEATRLPVTGLGRHGHRSDLVAGPTYQVSFSQYYRQCLLSFF